MNKYKEYSKSAHAIRLYRKCMRKKKYASKQEAFQKGQISYECKYCKGWHRASITKVRTTKGTFY